MRTNFRTFVSLCLFGFICLAYVRSFNSGAHAIVQEPKTTSTTVPDDSYVPGGTLTTVSDDKLRVISETWNDQSGNVIERHTFIYDKNTKIGETWRFEKGGKSQFVNLLRRIDTPGSTRKPEITWVLYTENLPDRVYKGADTEGQLRDQAEKILQAKRDSIKQELSKNLPKKEDALKQEAKREAPKQETTKGSTPETTKQHDPLPELIDPNGPKPNTPDKPSEPEKPKANEAPTKQEIPISVPGYSLNLTTYPWLQTYTLTGQPGTIKIYLPGEMSTNEPTSGSLWMTPNGKTEEEQKKNLKTLKQWKPQGRAVTFEYVDLNLFKNPDSYHSPLIIHFDKTLLEAREAYRHFSLASANGEIDFLLKSHSLLTPPTTFELPTGGQQGQSLFFIGRFDGNGANTFAKIDNDPLPLLAESPTGAVFLNTSSFVGLGTLTLTESGHIVQCPFRNIGVALSADQLNLLKGQTTMLHVKVLGLAQLDQILPLILENQSPAVISMDGGDRQFLEIKPEDVKQGVYATDRMLSSKMAGGFGITATVTWKDTCKHD